MRKTAYRKTKEIQPMLRKILFTLYVLVTACMAAATFVEKYRGTDFAHAAVYGSWWFTALWALLAAAAVAYIARRRMRPKSAIALHAAFVLILAGAIATRLTAERGMVHLRCGAAVDTYTAADDRGGTKELKLPFALRLDTFAVRYHDGTEAEADYVSRFTVIDHGRETQAEVSMNNIYRHGSVRFYQASYDRDGLGSTLALNSDPYGIPLTYAGYALLFLSFAWTLADPKGAYRRLLRHPLLRRGALALLLAVGCPIGAGAAKVLPRETADKFGRLYILYNGRVCPLQTFAVDFTKKLCGSARYKDYTAEQVLTGFIFYGDEWCNEPIIRMKNGALRDRWQLPRHCSVNTFFNHDMGGYILGPYVRDYYQGQGGKLNKQAADMDDRLMMVMNLRRGTPLKVFPCTSGGRTTWYAPTDAITDTLVDGARRKYIENVFSLVYQEVLAGSYGNVDKIFDKMLEYQTKNAGTSLPTPLQVKAERAYNAVPFATVLFMANLAAGLLLLAFTVWRMVKDGKTNRTYKAGNGRRPDNPGSLKVAYAAGTAVLGLSLLCLTACLALRWIVGGRVPMANGYETMLSVAWCVMLLGLAVGRRFRIAVPFGLLMSGFFLLVSHLSQMDPRITHTMPVLSSPLLGVHVSVIMMSFALLSLTFIVGLTALLLRLARGKDAPGEAAQEESLALLSRLMLYPALALLAVGVFIGAVWANVSWGTYWSWDAKETWGLITLMVYAAAVHDRSLPFLRRPVGYHLYMTSAFICILMTYFGVNYFLGGMHSYA